jgi:hypothetical protein
MKPKVGDFAIVVVIILIAVTNLLIYIGPTNGDATAVIIKNGKSIKELKLSEIKNRIEINNNGEYDVLIVAENGKIHFEEANCPDKVCIKTGWISKPGQSAACVPAGIIIKITGEDSDTDIILK